jgi:hypothetical protein
MNDNQKTIKGIVDEIFKEDSYEPTILDKLDSILEVLQTSSSDLTLPEGKDPVADARETLLEVEKKVKELIEFKNKTLNK